MLLDNQDSILTKCLLDNKSRRKHMPRTALCHFHWTNGKGDRFRQLHFRILHVQFPFKSYGPQKR